MEDVNPEVRRMYLPQEQYEMKKANERLLKIGAIDLITFQRVKYEILKKAKILIEAKLYTEDLARERKEDIVNLLQIKRVSLPTGERQEIKMMAEYLRGEIEVTA